MERYLKAYRYLSIGVIEVKPSHGRGGVQQKNLPGRSFLSSYNEHLNMASKAFNHAIRSTRVCFGPKRFLLVEVSNYLI